MIEMLRIPKIPLDARRKAHIRRWFYDLIDDYGVYLWLVVVAVGSFCYWMAWYRSRMPR